MVRKFKLVPVHTWGKYEAPYQILDSKAEAENAMKSHSLSRFPEWRFELYEIVVNP